MDGGNVGNAWSNCQRLQRCLQRLVALLAIAVSGAVHADGIDDFVNQELARQRIPGAALGIMHRGQLVRAAGYGFANVEHRVPVHPDTVFQTGSIGKQFTATVVMLLVEDGKVRLDESIRSYLPKALHPIALWDDPLPPE